MKHDCNNCSHGGAFPLRGDGFSRRRFLRVAGTGIVASWFADVADPRLLYAANGVAPSLQRTARNCILVFLSGAPSQVDMWDLKEGSWTPSSLAPTSYGGVRWPQGLLPKTGEHLGTIAIVRPGMAWALVHQLAQLWSQISRNPTGALGSVSPHVGAVVSLEMQASRAEGDVLPSFIALNSGNLPGAGYMPASLGPFSVQPSAEGLTTLAHPDGKARFDTRWERLGSVDLDRSSGRLGKVTLDMNDFYDQAKTMVDTPEVGALFGYSDEEYARYGSSAFGGSMVIAKKLLAANRGARFVQVTLGGWDHHDNIYGAAGDSLFTQCSQFDPAFASLLDDLAMTPGVAAGKTLLDETMVVVMAEFGRTTGSLNGQSGRDHYPRLSYVLAGGGVKGGRVIGRTNATGDAVVDWGWAPQRDVRPEDLTATLYSALGIDYTTIRYDDPLGRGFEYVPSAKDGLYQPVDELF
ncbi:MAG: DUF1501 domain-containing protein [Acidobacteria bacterium]|nr:DUF1501 domain-containing protein [Acidobacteriota bacterium]